MTSVAGSTTGSRTWEGTAAGAASPASAPPARRSRAKILLPVLVGVAALVGGGLYLHGRGKESTDDAFVESHVTNVAPRVPGQVLKVLVRDNQQVALGEVLLELDDRDAVAHVHAAQVVGGKILAASAAG